MSWLRKMRPVLVALGLALGIATIIGAKSLTGGKGSYSIAFSHYAQVPDSTQQQLASSFKAVELADD